MRLPHVSAIVAAAVITSTTSAQVFTARSSTLNFNYVYGAGGDTHTGNSFRNPQTLLLTDSDAMSFLNSTGGVLPNGEPYGAGAAANLSYQYSISGSSTEIQSISASASSQVYTGASGAGSAVMHSANPGNEIALSFTVTRPIDFHLTGTISLPFPSAFSYVALQRFNGFNWEYVFYSAFLPSGQGPFDIAGTLVPSQYRIQSVMSISAGANDNFTSSCSYLLDLPGLGGCTADFNADGVIDFFDYLDFVDAFSANSPTADFNSDGMIDFFDYLDFVDAFSGGC